MKQLLWRLVRVVHHADFAWFLPLIARLPLPMAYALSTMRGHINALTGRDWRSVALGFRHIRRQSALAYACMPGTDQQRAQWCHQRFSTEARDELEAQLVSSQRLAELHCTFTPPEAAKLCSQRGRGLVLLTPHFDSFYLGIAFLAQASGGCINSMSSAVSQDPRVDPAVTRHFDQKYRGLERYLNGGKVPDMERGLRPFYRMLERHETLVVLGDAPVLPDGAAMSVDFLGAQRQLAGGALRLAEHTDSDLGCYVCRFVKPGHYEVTMGPLGPARDPETIQQIYHFLGAQILAQPGLWWAADLLPGMPPTQAL